MSSLPPQFYNHSFLPEIAIASQFAKPGTPATRAFVSFFHRLSSFNPSITFASQFGGFNHMVSTAPYVSASCQIVECGVRKQGISKLVTEQTIADPGNYVIVLTVILHLCSSCRAETGGM